jgi:hypothetical protein
MGIWVSCSVTCIRLHSVVVSISGVQSDLKKIPLHVLNILVYLEVQENFRQMFSR